MTVQTALQQGSRLLEDAGVTVPRLTGEVLLAHAIHCERVYLYAHPERELSDVEWLHYGRYLHERLEGKPTQYITHRQEFWGRDFRVTPDVLIPRPETELIVEVALELLKDVSAPTIADIGTGSGCIAISLLHELSDSRALATDISAAALRVAQRNAERHGVTDRLTLIESDCFADVNPSESFNLIASNPPYVADDELASFCRHRGSVTRPTRQRPRRRPPRPPCRCRRAG